MEGLKGLIIDKLEKYGAIAKPYAIGFVAGVIVAWLL